MRRPRRMVLTIEPKSSSSRTMADASRATSVPRPPIAMPVSGLDGRRVVYAIARHGNDFTVRLQALDDAKLLTGPDACEYRCGFHERREAIIGHRLDVVARQNIRGIEPVSY